MPLSILVPMILIGLPFIIGLVYWVGRTNRLPALTADVIKARFAEDFPALAAQEIIIDDTGKTALMPNMDGIKIGLVHTIGQNYLTRLLDDNLVQDVKETENGIDLYVNDFTLKRVSFPLADAKMREALMSALTFK